LHDLLTQVPLGLGSNQGQVVKMVHGDLLWTWTTCECHIPYPFHPHTFLYIYVCVSG